MTSTKRRSIVKAVTWQTTGLVVLYIMTGSITLSLSYVVIRILMYVAHERIWQHIKWGWKRSRKVRNVELSDSLRKC